MLSAALLALVALVAAGCGGASDTKDATASSGGGGTKLSLVAYSTPQVVYEELAPKFAATSAGEGTTFSSSYGASADQSRAVESVLLSYENEAITAQQKRDKVDYVTPDQTILIENPVAVTTKAKPEAKKFLNFLWTPAAQTVFAKHGYRPVVGSVAKKFASQFPDPKTLFTIDDLGGWDKVMTDFFDPDKGSVAKIEQDAGVSTAK